MWTLAALAIFGFVGPLVIRQYEKHLYRSEAPWMLKELDASRDDASRGAV
jgi:hypothetical protein